MSPHSLYSMAGGLCPHSMYMQFKLEELKSLICIGFVPLGVVLRCPIVAGLVSPLIVYVLELFELACFLVIVLLGFMLVSLLVNHSLELLELVHFVVIIYKVTVLVCPIYYVSLIFEPFMLI